MNDFFTHDYYLVDDFGQATILCMRCAIEIAAPGVKQVPHKDDPKRTINVVYKQIHPHFAQVPIEIEDHQGSKKGVLLLCKDCANVPLEEKDKELIVSQIYRATEKELDNGHVDEKFRIQSLERVKNYKILGKSEGSYVGTN